MKLELFLERSRKWHGGREEEGMHTRTVFFITRDGKSVAIKETDQVLDAAGNVRLHVKLPSLACGHTVEDPREVVSLDGKAFCKSCVLRCPTCGRLIVPGQGEQVEQVWYHRRCAASPREHFELKRGLQEGLMAAQVESAMLQARHVQSQIDATYANIEIQRARLALEGLREKAQRALLAAQTHAVYENVRQQDERLCFEEMQSRERFRLEEKGLEQRERALESQLESERTHRAIEQGRFSLEWTERVARLEEQGYLPSGTARRLP